MCFSSSSVLKKFNVGAKKSQIIICKQSKICNGCEKNLVENVTTALVDVNSIAASHMDNFVIARKATLNLRTGSSR